VSASTAPPQRGGTTEVEENCDDDLDVKCYICEIGSFDGTVNFFPMGPKDLPKLTLEEARKKYIGKKYTHKVEMELGWSGFAYCVSMKDNKVTGVFGPAFKD